MYVFRLEKKITICVRTDRGRRAVKQHADRQGQEGLYGHPLWMAFLQSLAALDHLIIITCDFYHQDL